MVDGGGTVVKTYGYDVYGKVTSSSGSAPNEFDFAGQQVDGGTGLQYLRARYLDMETGRFISREPLMRSPGWTGNPYLYVEANPCAYTDPTGLVPGRPCRTKLKALLDYLDQMRYRFQEHVQYLDEFGYIKQKNYGRTYENMRNSQNLKSKIKQVNDKCGGGGGAGRIVEAAELIQEYSIQDARNWGVIEGAFDDIDEAQQSDSSFPNPLDWLPPAPDINWDKIWWDDIPPWWWRDYEKEWD
jgi:RHS repeat-associated protein